MRLALQTWNGHAINDTTNYEAVISPGNSMPGATANFIDLGQSNPILAGKTIEGGYFTFHIILRGSIETQRDTLNSWFNVADFTPHQLIAYDLDNGNKSWYLEGFPVMAPQMEEVAKASITLALSSPYWYETTANTNTWNITADSETEVMANAGNIAALPTFAITPNTAKSSNGLKYKTYYPVHTSGYGATKLPFDITAAGLDTATLIGAAKMQADGDDLLVSVNGVYVDRWFGGGGINSATTGVWVNLNFSPAPIMTLAVALNNSTTPATITVNYTGTVITLSQNSTLQIENEIITYSSYTVDTVAQQIIFIPTLRAAKGSTIATHATTTAVYWIENEIWLAYGDSAATAPVVNNNNKPIFDLTSSTNASWVFAEFGDSSGLRAAAPISYFGSTGQKYTGNRGANADPYTEMGYWLQSVVTGTGVTSNYNGFIRWQFFHPGGVSNFTATGEKYRVGSVWGRLKLFGYSPATLYYTEAAPTVESTWEAISINQAMAGNPTSIHFYMVGGLGTTLPAPYNYAELESVTLAIYDPPTVTPMGVEQVNYKLSGSLTNNTTAHSIIFNDVIGKTAQAITINCSTQEIYSADGKRLRGMIRFGGAKRDEWLTLEPGNNTIAFMDVGTDDLTIVTTWRGRNTI
jgi:hypothetical protein